MTNQSIPLDHGFQPEYEAGFAIGLGRNCWTVVSAGSTCMLVLIRWCFPAAFFTPRWLR
ncbi:MAG: hypothetical protein H5U26_11730 [Immundisolibacter sp.]|uniref:hypothetical protein n=1 Tax=Immundisolibacter sp. TaxID=1934948 RepID=UPI00199A855C|nr:hypothetical protein [Immundisolibacter sp.]MBC7162760.1 hypothetical protein [Immundisolibacter sp.]